MRDSAFRKPKAEPEIEGPRESPTFITALVAMAARRWSTLRRPITLASPRVVRRAWIDAKPCYCADHCRLFVLEAGNDWTGCNRRRALAPMRIRLTRAVKGPTANVPQAVDGLCTLLKANRPNPLCNPISSTEKRPRVASKWHSYGSPTPRTGIFVPLGKACQLEPRLG
jgi:hypothetical protein